MFYLNKNTGKRYTIGRPFNYNGIQYTKAGASHATFMSLGFTQVIVQQRPDDRFYVVSGPNANGSYYSTPRDLEQLKTEYIKQTKQQAFQLLKGTDWYIVRMLELGYDEAPVPADITAFRATTRTASTERCAAIEATTTVEELATLLEAPSTVYNAETDTTSDNPDALPQYPEQPEEGVYY